MGHFIFISYNEPTPYYLPLNPRTVGRRGRVFQVILKAVLRLRKPKERLNRYCCLELSQTGLLKYASEISCFNKAAMFRPP